MIDPEVLKHVVQNACFTADTVAMERKAAGDTGAQVTRAIIKSAIEALEANGIITVIDIEKWPTFYVPNPPYKTIFPRAANAD